VLRRQYLHFAPGWEARLRAAGLNSFEPAFLGDQGTVVRRSGSSEVRRVEVEGARQVLFLKKSWVTRWAQLRSRVFRGMLFGASQVRREFANLARLHEWQLTEAMPLAFGEERRAGWLWRSFLITTGIAEPMPVDAFIRDVLPRLAGAERRSVRGELLRQVARLTRVMHARQFTHGDLYWRNLVIAGTSWRGSRSSTCRAGGRIGGNSAWRRGQATSRRWTRRHNGSSGAASGCASCSTTGRPGGWMLAARN